MVCRYLLVSASGIRHSATVTDGCRETDESTREPGADPGYPTSVIRAPPPYPTAVFSRGEAVPPRAAQNSTSSSSISSGSCLAVAIHACISGRAIIV
jgi:hypothetical protein